MNAHVGQLRKENATSVDSAMGCPRKLAPVRNMRIAKLRLKPRMKLEAHRLPFVGRDHHQRASGVISFWDVPLTGGYGGGCATGKAIAQIYLAYLRQARHEDNPSLTNVIFSMVERCPADDEEDYSLRGQMVGFLCGIAPALMGAATILGNHLDDLDQDGLLKAANLGLSGLDERDIASVTNARTRQRTK